VHANTGATPLTSLELTMEAVIKGTHGDDSLVGTAGADTMVGGAGDDTLAGNEGADVIRGGRGDDVILVGDSESLNIYDGGGDHAFGADGDDYIYTQLDSTADGGAGRDGFYLDLGLGSDGVSGATVDLSGLDGGGAVAFGSTRLDGFEYGTLIGTDFADDIVIGTTAVAVLAGRGDDHIVTAGGDLADGLGAIHGGDGRDLIQGRAEADVLLGDAGSDTVIGGGGGDVLRGGNGADLVVGGAGGGGEILGDGGNDLIQVHGGDLLSGGAGSDIFQFYGRASLRSVIKDLHDVDTIDLTHIDADVTTAGRQHFVLVQAFDGHAGEAVLEAAGGDTLLRLDRDGDGAADASLTITGEHADFTNFAF
jgi:Ca2+-binding RTX toxin-like protein